MALCVVAPSKYMDLISSKTANRWHQSPLGGAAADCSTAARTAARVADDVSRYASADPVSSTYLQAGVSTKSGSSPGHQRRFFRGRWRRVCDFVCVHFPTRFSNSHKTMRWVLAVNNFAAFAAALPSRTYSAGRLAGCMAFISRYGHR